MKPKIWIITVATSFGLMILGSIAGGMISEEAIGPAWADAVIKTYMVLFFIMGFSLVPLMIRLFIVLQVKIGNGERAPIKWLQAHEKTVVYCIWAFYFVGLSIALSGGINEGMLE